jgi:acetyl esterase
MDISNALFQVGTEEVSYHQTEEGPLEATLYLPVGAGPFPAVVSVHGGRWCAETRMTNQVLDQALAEHGIVVMAIDFRMPPLVRYPVPVGDINLAVRWLKKNAGRYRIDSTAIGGIGTSSGGHQLLLSALLPLDPLYSAEPLAGGAGIDASLAYLIACWPVSDPVARYYHAMVNSLHVHINSHHAYWPSLAAMAEGSPQRIVEEGVATHLPPTLVIQGTDDVILTKDMADRFYEAFKSRGGSIALEKYAGEGHTFITKAPQSPASLSAIAKVVDFIHAKAGI